MPVEQFVYGMFPDGKIGVLKSPNVNNVLSDINFQILRANPNPREALWLETEQLVVVQFVDETSDRDGREWVWNHTFLIPIKEYIRITDPHQLFSKYVVSKDKPPTNLESIEIGGQD